jgi:hypothetical protein
MAHDAIQINLGAVWALASSSILLISTIYTNVANSHALISHTQEMTYLAVCIVVGTRLAVAIHHIDVLAISTGQTSSVLLQSSSIHTKIAFTISHVIKTANIAVCVIIGTIRTSWVGSFVSVVQKCKPHNTCVTYSDILPIKVARGASHITHCAVSTISSNIYVFSSWTR